MNGKDYVAVTALRNRQGGTLVKVGDTCEAIPSSSLAWLFHDGHIAKVGKASPASGDSASDPASTDTTKPRRGHKTESE